MTMSESLAHDPRTEEIWEVLSRIADPEIPPVSIVELGMVDSVAFDGEAVCVRFLPTFAGCPALDAIRDQIRDSVTEAGYDDVRVEAVFEPAWTTDRISEVGLEKLRKFGLAPPQRLNGQFVSLEVLKKKACPYCGSLNTVLETPFGPTLCRAIHYCNACKQSFEQFKPV
jgi:ring-1,2-phenylacetyl-CoA epoxidase subunit PaaD